MTTPSRRTTRDQVAARLLGGSIRRSHNSLVEIDWDAPQDPDLFYMPPETISLYGTPLWEEMSHRERVELSRQEVANTFSRAVWFENTLNQGLLRTMLYQDPTSPHVHYALTELGDETRHMVMFGKMVSAIGAEPYRLSRLQVLAVQAMPFLYRGLMLYVAALCGEEVIDDVQRKYLAHPGLQPIVAQTMRIHIAEEARHIRFAREGVRRRMQTAPWWSRTFCATANGAAAFILDKMFNDKRAYERCGLPVREAVRQAKANEYNRAGRRAAFADFREFLEDNNLLNVVSRAAWRRYGFLA
ncbi:diiron oxygenase [Amycolatopsis sp. NPDC059090]|uniref:AurF N-oxygenase family protein n=1 Tax=unclassified Amycolatopsis TaxID=2618356 RepID=UPI00366D731D